MPDVRPSAALRPAERIRRHADFQEVYKEGDRCPGRLMILFIRPNGLPVARLGIAATRRLGGAVIRNRAKRLVREVFRRHKPAPGVDVVVVPRSDLLNASLDVLAADFCTTLDRSRRARRR